MKTIYGPVPSWRFGSSLGIDPICSGKKICSFGCIYCQLGETKIKTMERKPYIDFSRMKRELEAVNLEKVDVITFSGTGEPTLNSELGEMIVFAKKFGLPVVVLTNSSLLAEKKVRKELCFADIVAVKLDAPNEEVFQEVNKPIEGLHFEKVLEGIRKFRAEFRGKFTLQMMFVEQNKGFAKEMAKLARELKPDEVQLDTPLRHSAAPPLSISEMEEIEKEFAELPIISVYKSKKPSVVPLDKDETIKRRPSEN